VRRQLLRFLLRRAAKLAFFPMNLSAVQFQQGLLQITYRYVVRNIVPKTR
jgi:hypothetical protein